jgi:hypothetical protein
VLWPPVKEAYASHDSCGRESANSDPVEVGISIDDPSLRISSIEADRFRSAGVSSYRSYLRSPNVNVDEMHGARANIAAERSRIRCEDEFLPTASNRFTLKSPELARIARENVVS